MSAFRTIYFRPRIALDWRIPVAALVRTRGGVKGVAADVLPDPRCLGSAASRGILEQGLRELLDCLEWSALPVSMGPHFELGREQMLPEVHNPVGWVRRQALPTRGEQDGESTDSQPKVRTIAWNHLRAWGVSSFVQKNLGPKVINETARIPDEVAAITHYVAGRSTVLLMEPVILGRRMQDVRNTIGRIYQRLSTYEHNWDRSRGSRQCSSLAYILPGTSPRDVIEDAARKLAPIATVFRTGDDAARHEFTQRIQTVGTSLELSN